MSAANLLLMAVNNRRRTISNASLADTGFHSAYIGSVMVSGIGNAIETGVVSAAGGPGRYDSGAAVESGRDTAYGNGTVSNVTPSIDIAVLATPSIYIFAATMGNGFIAIGVQYFLNGQPLGAELTTTPWRLTWDTDNAPAGVYQITARARDAGGLISLSNSIQIIVDSATGEPPGLLSAGGAGVYQPKNNGWYRIQER